MSISGPGSTPYGGHAGPVLSVAVAPDGSSLASGGSDGMVQVWDARTGQQQFQLAGHRGPVHSLAYSADGTLASAGQDGTVWIWNPRTGEKQQLTTQPGPIYAVAYAPDGRRTRKCSAPRKGRR